MPAPDSFSNRPLGVDLLAGGDGYSFAGTSRAVGAWYDAVIDRRSAKEDLHGLPERGHIILYMRFFEDTTQR
ncbi:hypothetical protein MBT84_46975 [Streptomyces sp. MBT84]|uniref:hypothetical protein n=1 Tax=Streptomyces sp. MBT84 TaxID=1488414 RepID=UPI001D547D12|nr:hypothetical protein [Streptomyces sp. MBT84]MBW8707202.1 hypothetical protein [Streptomyces sp. MBT84]